jgi:ubiquinone/menaquinone biosynthesis C-methylase UbiE
MMSEWTAETAEWYAEHYGDYPTNRLAVDTLELIHAPVIVDIGCGTGAALRHTASRLTGGTFIGIDPVPRMIEIAQALTSDHAAHARIEYRVGSAEAIPVASGSATHVYAFDSIDHWRDVAAGLREIRRILQPGGILVIVKDIGVPEAAAAIQTLVKTLTSTGWDIHAKNEQTTEDVHFVVLTCGVTDDHRDQ